MIGFSGRGRYADPALEERPARGLKAMRRGCEHIGMTSVELMTPVARTLDLAAVAMDILRKDGLKHGENGPMVNMMAELSSGVILAEGLLEYFDGLSSWHRWPDAADPGSGPRPMAGVAVLRRGEPCGDEGPVHADPRREKEGQSRGQLWPGPLGQARAGQVAHE